MLADLPTAPWFRRVLVAALIFGIVLLTFTVLQPFIVPLIWGAILSYVSWPLHQRIVRAVRGRNGLAALLTTLLVTLAIVVPLVWGGALYQDCYPLLVSDRYVIVEKSLAECDRVGTKLFAHGCTGMGNDQVRFDQSVRSLGDYTIIAPIRDIQKQHAQVRAFEAKYLEERGFSVRAKTGKYSINANLLGVLRRTPL